MIATTPTTTGRITMTVARTEMGITMKVLRRLLEQNGIEVDMAHRNCAQMTVAQFQRIVEVFMLEERGKQADAVNRLKSLHRLSTRNLKILRAA